MTIQVNVFYPDYAKLDEAKYYARFPEQHRRFVEEILCYRGQELLSGELSDEGFDEHVRDAIQCHESMLQQERDDLELFRQVGELLGADEFPEPHRSVLARQIAQGKESALLRFIGLQQLHGARDAALSFLAWYFTYGLVLLEEKFGLNLDAHRDERDSYWLSSKEALHLKSFSLAAQQLSADQ